MSTPTFDPTQLRILGTLIEKEFTVPDSYPLTLNSLVSGCNQKSNRDPVYDLQDYQIEGALRTLFVDGWVGQHSREGGRVVRWNERMREKLALDRFESAVLTELMLRGPQAPGALRGRASRMAPLASLEEAESVLDRLREKGMAELQPKRPGERAARWAQTLEKPLDDSTETDETEQPIATEPKRTTSPLFALPVETRVVRPSDPDRPQWTPSTVATDEPEPELEPEPEPAPAAAPPPTYVPAAAIVASESPARSDEIAEMKDEIRNLRTDLEYLKSIVEGLTGL